MTSLANASVDSASDSTMLELSARVGKKLLERDWTITAAESCTGGGFSAAITEVAGSSNWFQQGFVTYSNLAKIQCLGVSEDLLESEGAVSEQVVIAMLSGALRIANSEIGVAISGIAGPGGATEGKPVGTVCIAWGARSALKSRRFHFNGDRSLVRKQAIHQSLQLVLEWLEQYQ